MPRSSINMYVYHAATQMLMPIQSFAAPDSRALTGGVDSVAEPLSISLREVVTTNCRTSATLRSLTNTLSDQGDARLSDHDFGPGRKSLYLRPIKIDDIRRLSVIVRWRLASGLLRSRSRSVCESWLDCEHREEYPKPCSRSHRTLLDVM